MSFFSFQDIIACVTGIMLLITLLLAMELITRKEGGSEYPAVNIEKLTNIFQEMQKRLKAVEERIAARTRRLNDMVAGRIITPEEVVALARSVRALKDSNDSSNQRMSSLQGKYDKLKTDLEQAQKADEVLAAAVAKANSTIREQAGKRKVTLLGGKATGMRPLFVECSATQIIVGERIQATGESKMLKRFPGPGKDPAIAFVNWAVSDGRTKEKVQYVILVRPDAVLRYRVIVGTLLSREYLVGWDVWPITKTLFPQAGGGGD